MHVNVDNTIYSTDTVVAVLWSGKLKDHQDQNEGASTEPNPPPCSQCSHYKRPNDSFLTDPEPADPNNTGSDNKPNRAAPKREA